jgi:thioredoxin reductase (NADPH)
MEASPLGVLPANGVLEAFMIVDALIVGGGPAGLVAAVYLARFRRSVAVFDAGTARAALIPTSHNCPGFPDGIAGIALLGRLREQLEEVGGELHEGEVTALGRDHDVFSARIGDEMVRARTVLLATGQTDHVPQAPGIDEVRARGLLRQCPICDGYEFTGRRIAVIGAGDHGMRECQFLCNYSREVCLVEEAPGNDASLAAELDARGVHRVRDRVQAASVTTSGKVELEFAQGGRHVFDVAYSALGATPRSELARMLHADLDAKGAVIVDKHCASSVDGLYAAGDVVSALDQLAVAVGHAAIAATAIHNRLRRG